MPSTFLIGLLAAALSSFCIIPISFGAIAFPLALSPELDPVLSGVNGKLLNYVPFRDFAIIV